MPGMCCKMPVAMRVPCCHASADMSRDMVSSLPSFATRLAVTDISVSAAMRLTESGRLLKEGDLHSDAGGGGAGAVGGRLG